MRLSPAVILAAGFYQNFLELNPMNIKYIVVMIWAGSELVSGISYTSESEAWNDANELQALA